VTALLHVDLEEVAEVPEAGRRLAQVPLLFDRRRLGVALHDDEAAEVRPVLAGDVLPHGLAHVVPEGDLAVGVLAGEEDPPPVLGHLHEAEVGPPLLVGGDGGAEVDVVVLEGDRAQVPPPLQELRLPRLEGPL
jgi:hypothetical protein